MAIFGGRYLDGDKLRLIEDRLHGNISFPHAHIGNPDIAIAEARLLLLNGSRLPGFVVVVEPKQSLSLHGVVRVLARVTLLNLSGNELRIGSKGV
jgi:hypothetical protein